MSIPETLTAVGAMLSPAAVVIASVVTHHGQRQIRRHVAANAETLDRLANGHDTDDDDDQEG